MTPRCGACGWTFSERTMAKHAYTPCGEEDVKAKVRPELDDLIKMIEESEMEEDNE